ncbi:hypothetical protein OPQ81_006624 [Rhizoctonia solani]|nr:hypothetical protein OPQ81_006624 [Rhizoctonia solani]
MPMPYRNKILTPTFARFLRTKARSTTQLSNTGTFVGPPDRISNIRPVLRANFMNLELQRAHPYSLSEFSRQEVVGYSVSALHERHLEAFNHSFWTDVNTRFNASRQKILDSHPLVSPGRDTTARDAALEADLAAFYRSWLAEEDARFRAYILRYYAEQVRGIWLVFRSYWSS